MNKRELEFILQSKEGLKTEFKENVSGIDKDIVAFANAEGGRIFIGVDDKGKIQGINITNKLKSQIQDIARNCDPSINISVEYFENVLIIKINEGIDKPYKCSSGFYSRQGANSQKMTRNEILDFAIGEGKIRFDEQVNKEFKFPQDFDSNKLSNFLEKTKVKATLPQKDILINLGVAVKRERSVYLNNAGILFFAKNLKQFCPQAYTTCARYKGETRTNVIDRLDLKGDLIDQAEEAVKFLLKNTRLAYKFTGKPAREEMPEYPTEAIREGVINAIMHRDYFEKGGNIYLNIYSDRVEIINPGGLFKITKKELGKRASRRNEIIANLFHRIEFGEKLGSGIKRMNELMVQHGLPKPKFDISENFFEIIFYGPGESVLGGEIDLSKLNERQKKAIEYIKSKGKITNREYRKINSISSQRLAAEELKYLTDNNITKRHGKGRSIYYAFK